MWGKAFGWLARMYNRGFVRASWWQASLTGLQFFAYKALMMTLLFVGLGIVLHNFMVYFMTDYLTAIQGAVEDRLSTNPELGPFAIELTGLGAYLGTKLKLAESFTVLLVGLTIRSIRSFLPF